MLESCQHYDIWFTIVATKLMPRTRDSIHMPQIKTFYFLRREREKRHQKRSNVADKGCETDHFFYPITHPLVTRPVLQLGSVMLSSIQLDDHATPRTLDLVCTHIYHQYERASLEASHPFLKGWITRPTWVCQGRGVYIGRCCEFRIHEGEELFEERNVR